MGRTCTKTGTWMTIGTVFGMVMGVVAWLVADSFILFPGFTATGLAAGLALGAGLDRDQKSEDESAF